MAILMEPSVIFPSSMMASGEMGVYLLRMDCGVQQHMTMMQINCGGSVQLMLQMMVKIYSKSHIE